MSINIKREHLKKIGLLGLVAIICSAVLFRFIPGPVQAGGTTIVGLGITINYTDGTTSTVYSPNLASIMALSGVWYSNKQVTSFQSSVLVKSTSDRTASNIVYQGSVQVLLDGYGKDSLDLSQGAIVSGPVASITGPLVTAATMLTWVPAEERSTHSLEFRVVSGIILNTYTDGSSDEYAVNGQNAAISVTIDTTGITSQPPVIPPVNPPVAGQPVVTISASKTTAQVGEAVTYTSSVVNGTSPYTYQWYEAMGAGAYVVVGSNAATLQRTRTLASTYSVYLKVTDSQSKIGQSVAVVVTVTATPPARTYLYSDGFEYSGLGSNWTQTKSTGCTLSVVTSVAKSGSRSLACATTGATTWERVTASFQVASPITAGYYRCYTQFSSLPASGTYWSIPLNLRALTSSPGALAWFDMHTSASGTFLFANYRDAALNNSVSTQLPGAISANTWHCLEIYVKVGTADGEVRFYVDGTLLFSKTALSNNEWGGINYVYVGEYYASANSGAHTTFVDDVKVDTVYIGP